MTEKRFTVHIDWFNYDKTEGEIELKDNGQPLLVSRSVEDVQWIKTLLNELNDENEQLKQELYLIDKLIEDLGHEEMKRQYEEICGDSDD